MDLVGHKHQRHQLLQDLKNDNVSHAYLFTGPPHVGKFTVAKWFAKELLLKDVDDEHREKAEQMIDRLIHPDLLVLDKLWIEDRMEDWNVLSKYSNVPQDHRKKAGAKTDRISIDDIRALQQRIMETGMSRYRAICIRNIERMEDPPANALLKVLEEPPEGRVFLLTTESTDHILPTIASRCRVIRFSAVPPQELQPLLQGLDPEEAHFLTHISQGAPGLLLSLRDDPEKLREERLLHTQAGSFWRSADLSERLKLLEPMTEKGADPARFVLHLALTLREQPVRTAAQEQALRRLGSLLATNAQRPLLAVQFAMASL